jgi:hypothetical protein
MAISGRGSQALNSLGVERSTGGIQVMAVARGDTMSRPRAMHVIAAKVATGPVLVVEVITAGEGPCAAHS